jgi:cytochrome c5
MRSNAAIGVLIAAIVAIVLLAIGAPHDRPAPAPRPAPTVPEPSVAGGGLSLASASIELPADEGKFPAGPGAEVADRVCTACHSASMILTQPPLTSDQWAAEIKKMAEVYKARITPDEATAIHAYLVGMTAGGARPVAVAK